MSLGLSHRGEGSDSTSYSSPSKTNKPSEVHIGGISGKTFFEEIFPGDVTSFDGKKIFDFGAGYGNILHELSLRAKPKQLVAYDPVYGKPLEQGLVSDIALLERVKTYALLNLGSSNKDDINLLSDIDAQQVVLNNYHNQNGHILRIPYLSYIPAGTTFDRVFVMSVLTYVPSLGATLQNLDSLLSRDGEMYVVDFISRDNDVLERLKHAGIPIVKTYNQYFFTILKKGDAWKIY